MSSHRRFWISVLVLAAAILLSMGRIVFHGFSSWDDPHTIAQNPSFQPPTISSAVGYWHIHNHPAGLYVPVTYTIWGALAAVSLAVNDTLVAWPFHLTSVLSHLLASVMVLMIIRRIVPNDLAALTGAMFFALHPLQVEAVAWASGFKDVLAAALALVAVWQYLVAIDTNDIVPARSRRFHFALSTIAFAAAMLAKPSAVAAVPIAAALDVLVVRRSIPRAGLSLIPWLVAALPLLLIARVAQETHGVPSVPLWQRPLIATDAIAFYLLKLLFPVSLAMDYGRAPNIVMASRAAFVTWLVPTGFAIAILASRSRVLMAAGLIFVGGMLLNLGLVPFQFQFNSTVADHYVYFSMLGPALAVAWMVDRKPTRATFIVCGLVLATLATLIFRQAGLWRDNVTLFAHAVRVNPDSAAARNNLGTALAESGDTRAAIEQLEMVLSLEPLDPMARKNLALLHLKEGNRDAAIRYLSEAVQLFERAGASVPGERRLLIELTTPTTQSLYPAQ